MKYAKIDHETKQMQGRPCDLPQRWTTPEGATINGFNLLPDPALYALAWAPVVYDVLPNPETHVYSLIPEFREDVHRFVFAAVPRDLSLLKIEAYQEIDDSINTVSKKYISTNTGQDMRYLLKLEQAKAFKVAYESGEPVSDDSFPFVTMEAAATGDTPIDRATFIIATGEQLVLLGATIEAIKISGKDAIEAATTPEGVVLARDSALLSLGAI